LAGASVSDQPRPMRPFSIVGLATIVTSATDFVIASTGLLAITSQGAGQGVFDWRNVDWTLYLKPQLWRLRVQCYTSGTAAPGQSVYATLYEAVPSVANAGAITLGNEVAGARGPTTTLSLAGVRYDLTGPQANAPADGLYVPILHANAAWAANSGALITGAAEVLAR
jgi:hypothetical protein